MDPTENARLPAFMQAVGLVVASEAQRNPSSSSEPPPDLEREVATTRSKMSMWSMSKHLQQLIKIRNKSRQEYYKSYSEVKRVEYEILDGVTKKLKTKRQSSSLDFEALKGAMAELIDGSFLNRIHMRATNSRSYKIQYEGAKKAVVKLIRFCNDFNIPLDGLKK